MCVRQVNALKVAGTRLKSDGSTLSNHDILREFSGRAHRLSDAFKGRILPAPGKTVPAQGGEHHGDDECDDAEPRNHELVAHAIQDGDGQGADAEGSAMQDDDVEVPDDSLAHETQDDDSQQADEEESVMHDATFDAPGCPATHEAHDCSMRRTDGEESVMQDGEAEVEDTLAEDLFGFESEEDATAPRPVPAVPPPLPAPPLPPPDELHPEENQPSGQHATEGAYVLPTTFLKPGAPQQVVTSQPTVVVYRFRIVQSRACN